MSDEHPQPLITPQAQPVPDEKERKVSASIPQAVSESKEKQREDKKRETLTLEDLKQQEHLAEVYKYVQKIFAPTVIEGIDQWRDQKGPAGVDWPRSGQVFINGDEVKADEVSEKLNKLWANNGLMPVFLLNFLTQGILHPTVSVSQPPLAALQNVGSINEDVPPMWEPRGVDITYVDDYTARIKSFVSISRRGEGEQLAEQEMTFDVVVRSANESPAVRFGEFSCKTYDETLAKRGLRLQYNTEATRQKYRELMNHMLVKLLQDVIEVKSPCDQTFQALRTSALRFCLYPDSPNINAALETLLTPSQIVEEVLLGYQTATPPYDLSKFDQVYALVQKYPVASEHQTKHLLEELQRLNNLRIVLEHINKQSSATDAKETDIAIFEKWAQARAYFKKQNFEHRFLWPVDGLIRQTTAAITKANAAGQINEIVAIRATLAGLLGIGAVPSEDLRSIDSLIQAKITDFTRRNAHADYAALLKERNEFLRLPGMPPDCLSPLNTLIEAKFEALAKESAEAKLSAVLAKRDEFAAFPKTLPQFFYSWDELIHGKVEVLAKESKDLNLGELLSKRAELLAIYRDASEYMLRSLNQLIRSKVPVFSQDSRVSVDDQLAALLLARVKLMQYGGFPDLLQQVERDIQAGVAAIIAEFSRKEKPRSLRKLVGVREALAKMGMPQETLRPLDDFIAKKKDEIKWNRIKKGILIACAVFLALLTGADAAGGAGLWGGVDLSTTSLGFLSAIGKAIDFIASAIPPLKIALFFIGVIGTAALSYVANRYSRSPDEAQFMSQVAAKKFQSSTNVPSDGAANVLAAQYEESVGKWAAPRAQQKHDRSVVVPKDQGTQELKVTPVIRAN